MKISKRRRNEGVSKLAVSYLTINDVMDYLQVSRPTVYKYFKWGLPSYKVGKSVRVSLADLEKWILVHQRTA